MDGSAFRNLDFSWLPWVIGLAGVGLFCIVGAIVYLLYWLATHVTVTFL